jgi:hypothetical protein
MNAMLSYWRVIDRNILLIVIMCLCEWHSCILDISTLIIRHLIGFDSITYFPFFQASLLYRLFYRKNFIIIINFLVNILINLIRSILNLLC